MEAIGKTMWAVAEGYIPAWSHGSAPELASHEALCILNTGDREAHVDLTLYFPNRDPAGPYHFVVAGKRTLHIRLNPLQDPEPVEKGKEFASLIHSDTPIVVQHSRLDSRQNENALMTTIAYAQ